MFDSWSSSDFTLRAKKANATANPPKISTMATTVSRRAKPLDSSNLWRAASCSEWFTRLSCCTDTGALALLTATLWPMSTPSRRAREPVNSEVPRGTQLSGHETESPTPGRRTIAVQEGLPPWSARLVRLAPSRLYPISCERPCPARPASPVGVSGQRRPTGEQPGPIIRVSCRTPRRGTLPDRTVVATLDHPVGVVPDVVFAVPVRLCGDTEVDQKPGQPTAKLGTVSKLTGYLRHGHNVRQVSSPPPAFRRLKPSYPTAVAPGSGRKAETDVRRQPQEQSASARP